MQEIRLDVHLRNEIGSRKIKKVRREDFVPAIVYGDEQSPTSVKVDRREYERIMRHHRGQSVIFHLNVLDGKGAKDYSAIIREEQHDPVSDRILHIDFNRISLKKEVEVKVPIDHKGDAVGVKKDGGSLDQPLRELDIVCLPLDIPEKIVVDVSQLNIGDAIHVRDIALPKGVRTKHDPDSIVFSVVPPMKEEVTPAEGVPTEPEVLKEKKDKEKVEGEAAPAAKAEEAKKPEAKEKK